MYHTKINLKNYIFLQPTDKICIKFLNIILFKFFKTIIPPKKNLKYPVQGVKKIGLGKKLKLRVK